MRLEEIVEPLLGWYAENARDLPWRREVTPYRVWISEIMLQQTRVEAVKGYFVRFIGALPGPAELAAVDERELLKLWEGLGYYSRARNLQKAARVIMETYGGELPASHEALLTLPGVGPYTAGAVASIAFGLPEPAVDGNVLRVLSRLTADNSDIADPAVKRAAERTVRGIIPAGRAGAFNQALMELGATVCAPNGPPACGRCPLAGLCAAHAAGNETAYPVKAAKKARRVEERTVLLLVRDELLALRRRPAKGLLAGLWELPNLPGALDGAGAVEAARTLGLAPLRVEPLGPAKHIFTHIEWHMTAYTARTEGLALPEGWVWADREALAREYAVPNAFQAFSEYVKGKLGYFS